PSPDIHPRIQQAIRESYESELKRLRRQVEGYEAFRAGVIKQVDLRSLDDLPESLIRGRIAAGLTQKELAERLGKKEQQIQRYEATRYAGASLKRLQAVAEALGVKIEGKVRLPGPHRERAEEAGGA